MHIAHGSDIALLRTDFLLKYAVKNFLHLLLQFSARTNGKRRRPVLNLFVYIYEREANTINRIHQCKSINIPNNYINVLVWPHPMCFWQTCIFSEYFMLK